MAFPRDFGRNKEGVFRFLYKIIHNPETVFIVEIPEEPDGIALRWSHIRETARFQLETIGQSGTQSNPQRPTDDMAFYRNGIFGVGNGRLLSFFRNHFSYHYSRRPPMPRFLLLSPTDDSLRTAGSADDADQQRRRAFDGLNITTTWVN